MRSAPRRARARLAVLSSIAFLAGWLGCKTSQGETGGGPGGGADAPLGRARSVSAPDRGEVAPIVRSAREQAVAQGQKLVVYVGATWCDPCTRFHNAVSRGELDATFPGLVLLEFDSDRDGERLAVAGYSSRYIPLLALPRQDGTASGKQVEGGIKGDGAVAVVTEKLKGLLAQR